MEKKFLRKACGPKINNLIQRYEIRSNEEVNVIPLENQIQLEQLEPKS